MRYEVYGGPYDGAKVTCTITGDFVYTDGHKSFKHEGKGRVLCRRWERHGGGLMLMYAENAYVKCPGCSVFHARGDTEKCTLCGTTLRVKEAA